MSRTVCAIGQEVVPASFKGVPFYCTEADIEGGRRGAEGEFPFGEDTAYADLGRKIRTANLSAIFRENSHVSDAQALFSACESPGPGLLVHPTRGSFMAACRRCKLTDALEESGGETRAELEFVEANSVTGLFGAGSLFGIISSALNTTSQESFLRDYQPMTVAQPWRVDVIDTAQELVGAVSTIVVQTLPPDASTQAWRDALRIEEVAKDDGLASYAVNVDAALASGFQTIAANIADANAKFRTMRKLANLATGSAAIESEEAVMSRHRLLAAVGMAEAAMSRKYTTVSEALEAKDVTLAVFNDEAQIAYADCDNPLFLEIRNYSTSFAKMMDDLSYRLPGLVIVDFQGGVHPLVAAYAIYRDAKKHRQLEERNQVDANARFRPVVVGVTPMVA
jgi:DNA circularisation protein N-terminus